MKAVPERRCRILTPLLSSGERHRDGWLQTEAREIQMRMKAGEFHRLALIRQEKLPRKAGDFEGFRSSPAASLKETWLRQHIKLAGEILWVGNGRKGFCRQ